MVGSILNESVPGEINQQVRATRATIRGVQRRILRLATTIVTAAVLQSVLAATVAAEASFQPGVAVTPDETSEASLDPSLVPILLVAVVAIALAFVIRARSARGSGRGMIGFAVCVVAILLGGLFVLAGLMGDLSGQRRIFVVPLVAGIALIGGAAYGVWRLRQAAAGSASDRPIG
jgi:hypothetical protein